MDGFDHYPLHQSTDLAGEALSNFLQLKGWNNGNAISYLEIGAPFARGVGQGLANRNSGIYIHYPVADQTTYITGIAYRGLGSWSSTVILAFLTSATGALCDVRTDASGHLVVTRNGTVLATSTNTLTLDTHYYIEFKALINASTGTYEVRVNGTSTNWCVGTGANTGTGNIGQVRLQGGAATMWFDDFYICDTTGSAPNNTFLGPCKVGLLLPSEPGNYAQWTGNGGINAANVADSPHPDGDTSFNQSATANQIDSFKFPDLPASAGSVFAIQHNLYAKQDGGAQRTITAFQRSGTTDYASAATKNTSTSYAYYKDVKETNPDTAAAWTVAGLNAAEFGYKITA